MASRDRQEEQLASRGEPRISQDLVARWLIFVGPALLIVVLYLTTHHSYLLYHALVEMFAIIIGAGIFMIAWNARAFMANNYLLCIGVAYLFVGALDLLHVLAYKGMGVFPESWSVNRAAQLWIAARGLEAVSLALATFCLNRPLRASLLPIIYTVATGALVVAIFTGGFPVCFVEGQGLTRFKIGAEVAICLVLLGAALMVWRRRKRFDPTVFKLALAAIITTIASEAAFTAYDDPFGLANKLGHLLKVVSFYLLYRATIATALSRPYSLLFRDLKLSEEALRRTNLELEGYAHTVSHDLKNPLAAVIGGGQALDKLLEQEPPNPADLRRMSEIITRSGRKAVELINDLLVLAEAGQQPRQVEMVRVGETVARILEERAASINERQVRLKIDEDLGTLRAAPAHVYQLFSNLIANALRHNQSPTPELEVRRLPGADSQEHRFLVRDNGDGIAVEDLPRIFQPFFKGRAGGHGIGLSTVSKLVRLYRGEIRVYNDQGACFELSLRDWQE